MKIKTLLIFLFCSLAVCSQHTKTTKPDVESIMALADEYLEINPQASGVIAAIAHKEQKDWIYATGYKSTEKNQVLEGNEPFIAASITKMFLATCILQMEEEQLLSLNDKVSRYVDKALLKKLTSYRGKSYEKELTVEQLLRHTSGISDYLNNTKTHLNAYKNHPDRTYSLKDRMEIALQVPSSKKFGKYHYSNTNYILLGMIAETVDLAEISEIIKKRIITPLGLRNTSLKNSDHIIPTMFKGYYTDWDLTAFTFYFNQSNPAGGLLTNVNDLLIFGKSVFKGTLFKSENTLKKMLDFQNGYGLGIMLYEKSKKLGPVYGHSGFDPGYTCYLAYIEKLDTVLVTVINQSELAVVMPAFLLVKTVHLIRDEQ